MSRLRYALHPDLVMSATDGQIHYITVHQLAHLYRLDPDQYMVVDDRADRYIYTRQMRQAESLNLTHLYPRYDGDYRLPEAK